MEENWWENVESILDKFNIKSYESYKKVINQLNKIAERCKDIKEKYFYYNLIEEIRWEWESQ